MPHATSSLLILAALALSACRGAGTVVTLSTTGSNGQEAVVPGMPLVILPYDRDSVARALAAAGRVRPDTTELIRLLDTLRSAYTRSVTLPEAERPAARSALDHLRSSLTPRLDSLRRVQQTWRADVFGGYDTLTLGLIHRLSRDPFTDTTDARGVAVVAPKMSGPWWVTVSTWDPADPYSEWYWNVPLTGDTIHLTPANAHRRTRI